MNLEEIFATPLQVRLIKIFLENPNKLFSTRLLAKLANSSPSAIISKLKNLTQLGVIKVLEINRLKLYQLDLDNKLTRILLDFFKNLKQINQETINSAR